MGTYVRVTRDELEDWFDTLPNMRGKWKLKPGRAGVYLLPLSDTVAVSFSSTIGTKDDAMGRGKASMKLSLVSLVTGQVLNKKAMGQSHFNRTTNWRTTWVKGFDRMKDAYLKAKSFYDTIATITDRGVYRDDLLSKIEAVPGWEKDSLLSEFHTKVDKGGILTVKQVALIDRKEKAPARSQNTVDKGYLDKLRRLWVLAKKAGDQWTMDFIESIGKQLKAGRTLSPKQQQIVDDKLHRYRVSSRVANRLLIRSLLASEPAGPPPL